MSWLSDLVESIGSAFSGSSSAGDLSSPNLTTSDGFSTPDLTMPDWGGSSTGTIPTPDDSKGGFSWGSLLPSLVTAGTGLAGVYGSMSNNSANLAGQEQQAANQLAFDKEKLAAELQSAAGAAGAHVKAAMIAAGATKAAARMNSLSNLYANWAGDKEKAGQSLEQGALELGKNATAPIMARLGAR